MKAKTRTKKKLARRMVTFEGKDDRELWKLGSCGGSNQLIHQYTHGQTNGQIHYRLRVLKDTLHLKESLRNRWKNGHNPLFWQFVQEYDAVLMADLDSEVVPKLVHPTPQTVKL